MQCSASRRHVATGGIPAPHFRLGAPHSSQLPRYRRTASLVKASTPEHKPDSSPTTTIEEQPSQPQTDSLATKSAGWAAQAVASPLFYLVAGLAAIQLVSSTGEQAGSILVFAALPVTALTALSKSQLGKQVQDALAAQLPQLQAEAEALRAEHTAARKRSAWYGSIRRRLPGALGSAPHLLGHVAGDQGFDPLGLAVDPAVFARHHEAELLHARWAMLAAVGCLVPEVLSMQGVALGEPVWWKVGAAKLQGDLTFNWGGIEGFRIAGKQGIGIIAACQLALMGGPEYARYVGIRSLEPVGVFLPGCPDSNYPGGAPFDPLGFSNRPDEFVDQAVKEIKNGRLAMVAMLGYFAQAAVTREGPVKNLLDFWEDPGHNNVFTRLAAL
ncbi:chlorophyll a/b-binding protein [Haematococcus lacustris]